MQGRSVLTMAQRVGWRGDSHQLIGYGAGMFSGVCYGGWNVIAKTALDDYNIPPLLFVFIAFSLGTLMFAPALAITLPSSLRIARRSVLMYLLAGVGSGGAIICLVFALERGEVIVISPLNAMSPLVTLVIARLFLMRLERITLPLVIGALLVVLGGILVVIGDRL